MNLGIQIYTNDETVEHLQIITGELMKGVPEKRPFRVGSFTVIPFYLPHTTRDRETGWILPCQNYGYIIEHEEMGKMIYATDMQAIARSNGTGCLCEKNGDPYRWILVNRTPVDNIPYGKPCWLDMKALRLNHMLIECNYIFNERNSIDPAKRIHVLQGHHSLEACKGFVNKNKTTSLKTITLCHVSQSDGNPEVMKNEIQETSGTDVLVQIATPGLEVNLDLCPF